MTAIGREESPGCFDVGRLLLTYCSRSRESKSSTILSRVSNTVLLLSALCLLSAPVYSVELLTAVDSETIVPPDLQKHLDSPLVIRYRFVRVDIEYLWNLFESARDLNEFDPVDRIKMGFFDDFSVELKLVKVNHRYWSSHATFVSTLPGFGADPNANIFASVTLKRGESASARIWAAGDIYYIAPVENGPVHVITQVDPEKMPAID